MTTSACVVLLPGFSRRAENLQVMSALCADQGWEPIPVTLAPRALAPLYMSRARLRHVSGDILRRCAGRPIVVVGHSAGGAAGCFIARCLAEAGADVRGLVLADGVDSPNGLIRQNLPELRGLRVSAVGAEPSPCNRHGRLGESLRAVPWVHRVDVPGAGHGDFEGHGIAIYRRACGDTSSEETSDRYRRAVVREVAACLGPS